MHLALLAILCYQSTSTRYSVCRDSLAKTLKLYASTADITCALKCASPRHVQRSKPNTRLSIEMLPSIPARKRLSFLCIQTLPVISSIFMPRFFGKPTAGAASKCRSVKLTQCSCHCSRSACARCTSVDIQSNVSKCASNQSDTAFNSRPISCFEKASYILIWCVRLARILEPRCFCLLFIINGSKVMIPISTGFFHYKITFYTIKSNRYVY